MGIFTLQCKNNKSKFWGFNLSLKFRRGLWFFLLSIFGSYIKKFVFLDFGSNLGIYSLISSYNPNCKYVVAFDPLPNIKKIILKNFRLNKVKGKFYNFGIYSKNIQRKLYTVKNHSWITSIIKQDNKGNFINANFKNFLF